MRDIRLGFLFFGLLFMSLTNFVKLLENGMARTPPMGWMSWGYYMCGVDCDKHPEKCLDEKLVLSIADKFYTEGYQEAGYEYIVIDDCWAEKKRNEFGRLVPDKKRFPNGMKYIADYIHKRGLKFGMYTNVGDITCMRYPGSGGYFDIDAKTFAEWDVDYIKVDGCFVSEEFLNEAYILFGEHLNSTGRSMVYSCSWPYYVQHIHGTKPNYSKIMRYCNMWRNFHDVAVAWEAVKFIVDYYQSSYDELQLYHGPGHWNDPDMLIFGTGALTDGQSRIQLAVYAMLAAPLLLSCDMNRITANEKKLLLNMNLLAIGQDVLGVMGKPYKLSNSLTLWVKPHLPRKGDLYNSISFALVNMELEDTTVSFSPGKYGMNSTDMYTVMDIFNQAYIKNISRSDTIHVTVPGEDVVMYTLYPL